MNPRDASSTPAAPWWRPTIKAHAWITVVAFYSSVLFVVAVLILLEEGHLHPAFAAIYALGLPEPYGWIATLVLSLAFLIAAAIPGFALRSLMRRKVPASCPECTGPAFLRIEGRDNRYFYRCNWCGAKRDSGVEEAD